jgi:hypothetical protein
MPTKDSRILIKEEDHELHFEMIKTDDSGGILRQLSKKEEQQHLCMYAHALRKCVCLILVLTTRFGDPNCVEGEQQKIQEL